MKSVLIVIASLIISNCFCQTIIKNEIDEFTKHKVIETSYEPLVQNFKLNSFASIQQIDSIIYLRLTLVIGSGTVHSIDDDAIFYIKLTDDSIVELKNLEYALSCRGCVNTGRLSGSNAMGTKTTYILSTENVKELLSKGIKKIRIYTSKGYIESDINPQRADAIKNELALIK